MASSRENSASNNLDSTGNALSSDSEQGPRSPQRSDTTQAVRGSSDRQFSDPEQRLSLPTPVEGGRDFAYMGDFVFDPPRVYDSPPPEDDSVRQDRTRNETSLDADRGHLLGTETAAIHAAQNASANGQEANDRAVASDRATTPQTQRNRPQGSHAVQNSHLSTGDADAHSSPTTLPRDSDRDRP